ncbi:DUF6090 family protein [uncultured Winogradskyella sp.]|uniref:DUF6090 family protein n=1 Tax=uncultured Winogradskyella sp. TaxID=395353 RepID=UPI00260C954C|nr:DUF6090 family protein [uncultured Winogradskyella sp.]
MIKFFRKIRQKTLIENKFSKYLLYAIGEIILVVIGILIALSINNRNENRKLEEKRVIYYQQLIIDLKSDKAYAKSLISTFEDYLKTYEDYTETFEEPSLNATKTLHNLRNVKYTVVLMDFETNTINTLINSGDISLLPQEINNSLTTYLGRQNKMIDGNNGNVKELVGMLRNASTLGGNISLRKRLEIQPELNDELKITDNQPQLILVLEAFHLWNTNTSTTSIKRLNDLIEDADATIDSIDKELNK